MPYQDYLYLLAELAAAFVGFTAIGLMIGVRRGTVWNFAIAGLIERGLAAGFFALLPSLIDSFGLAHSLLWKLCSLGLALYLSTAWYRSSRQWSSWDKNSRPVSSLAYNVRAGLSVIVTLLAYSNVYFGNIGIYLMSLVWILVAAAWMLLMLMEDLRKHDTSEE